ncbi:putative periplasmic binding protein-like I [Helianthus annuus]|nr:putative periplasmic binding protein-like I [Helianthus annuus]
MHNVSGYLILSLVAFSLPCFLLLQATIATGSLVTLPKAGNETGIGVILDQTSRPGKEAKVAIELAIQDFNINTDQPLVLHLKNSRNKPGHAFIAAKELIEEHKVKAILGGHTWEEASTIAEVISDSEHDHDIPLFLSLAGTTSLQPTDQWPFFIQAVPTQSTQMDAVAAILQSMGIRQVTLIYETSSSASIISHLTQALHQTGSELTNILPLTSSSCSLDKELELVKRQQRKVFVVHESLELGVRLFQIAKKMEMVGDGYLWIATNAITDLFHSVNSTVISSLKGMVGVKSYFPENTPDFLHFRKRFRQKFHLDYPEDEQDEPGIFAVQGYNAMKMVEKFNGLKTVLANTVEIVNVNGKGYHSVYWTEGLGFSETVENEINGASNYTHLIDNVGEILWPVQPWYASRRRRNLAGSSQNRLRVGVPAHSLFKQFVFHDNKTKRFSGFVVDVFHEMMTKMNQPYDLFPFHDSYDDLVKAIDKKEFDAVAGDVTILSERHEFADFTQPYTESGLEMIVPVRSRLSNQPWLFLKPFTAKMWWITAAITTYNGFVIWLIERNHNKDLQGNIITQIGIILWLAFSTLFTLRGDKMHSNLSRMAVVMWLFVALIITQSYTASLASMLTAQRLEPTITSVEMLRNMNATVGYCNGSYINRYLENVLEFKDFRIKSYNSTHGYAEGLNSGEIKAIFLEVPAAKVFLAQYCKSFIRTGETFKVGGFGFAFHRGFERLSEANGALMNVSESGKIKELEEKHLISEECVDEESSPDENGRLNLHSFWVLFVLTGGTSTVALVIYIVISFKEFKTSNQEDTSLSKRLSAFIKDWQRRMRRSSSIVASVESARHTRNIDQADNTDDDS